MGKLSREKTDKYNLVQDWRGDYYTPTTTGVKKLD